MEAVPDADDALDAHVKKWRERGEYVPYESDQLIKLLLWIKARVPPWIWLNCVARDIPEHYISTGNVVSNLRQVLHKRMKQRELRCRCICCREIGAFFCEQNGNRPQKGSRNGNEKVKKSRRSRKRKRHKRKNNTQSC